MVEQEDYKKQEPEGSGVSRIWGVRLCPESFLSSGFGGTKEVLSFKHREMVHHGACAHVQVLSDPGEVYTRILIHIQVDLFPDSFMSYIVINLLSVESGVGWGDVTEKTVADRF